MVTTKCAYCGKEGERLYLHKIKAKASPSLHEILPTWMRRDVEQCSSHICFDCCEGVDSLMTAVDEILKPQFPGVESEGEQFIRELQEKAAKAIWSIKEQKFFRKLECKRNL